MEKSIMKKLNVSDMTVFYFPKKPRIKAVCSELKEAIEHDMPSMFYVDFTNEDLQGLLEEGNTKGYRKAVNEALTVEVLCLCNLNTPRNERAQASPYDIYIYETNGRHHSIEDVSFEDMLDIVAVAPQMY